MIPESVVYLEVEGSVKMPFLHLASPQEPLLDLGLACTPRATTPRRLPFLQPTRQDHATSTHRLRLCEVGLALVHLVGWKVGVPPPAR